MTAANRSVAQTTADTDMIQTWQWRNRRKACEQFGGCNVLVTETLNFHKLTVSTHAVGHHEGDRVDERSGHDILPSVTPSGAAHYRATHGYTRIG